MFRNYLKTAVRNILRYKGFSLINISSLAIGVTCCLIIGLFVWDELQYDRFVRDGDRIHRMYMEYSNVSGKTLSASVPPMFATHLQANYPEVEKTMRMLMFSGKLLMEAGDKRAYEDKGLIADPTFFDFFPLKFIQGDPGTALDGTASVVITQELARKYFGTSRAVGKLMKIDKGEYTVTGVLAPLPRHFHLDPGYVLPLAAAAIPPERMEKWTWNQFYTYVKVHPGTDIRALERKFGQYVNREINPQSLKDGRSSYTPFFQALKDVHLKSSEFTFDNAIRGNALYVKGLTVIVFFVLVIACFNFVNLATARSFRRAKEIGVRKVIGADRNQLILQFTGETILFSFLAVMVAAAATYLLLPSLNGFTGKSITFNPFSHPVLALLLIGGALLIGILAGAYPALFMSGFKPIRVLKGLNPAGDSSRASGGLRHGLVIVQFALSALLIICTVIVYRQMNYLQKKDLGFSKDQILYFDLQGDVAANPGALKSELLRSPGVLDATAGYGLPGDQLAGDQVIVPTPEGEKTEGVNLFIVDHDYIKTMGLTILAGRDFSRNFPSDTSAAFIINETAVRELGFGTPQQALGQKISWPKWVPDPVNPVKKGQIIGVVKDFHFKSLHEKVSSAVLQIYPQVAVKMALKVREADLPATLDFIKSAYAKFSPDYPLDYRFLDENFEAMYQSEEKLSTLLWIFTVMAVFVGSLGLFGLAAFNAEQRTREIGIRKVLGASAGDIVVMLSQNFLRPVLIASVIAFPVAWWLMNNWLNDFPYRVGISWWVFLLTAGISLLVAFMTVSFHAIKAAVSNPVNSLRTE